MTIAVRVLLFVDIVDSTAITERLGIEGAAELWARHDAVSRELFPVHHGQEIDRTDGFLLLFDNVPDAVACAIAYHRAIAPLGLAARAGVHVGEVILRENPAHHIARGAKLIEVEGVTTPTAARVMSIAQAGQTLLTSAAHDLLGDVPWRVASHGFWRMKGLSEPVEVFEVGADDAPFSPPPDAAKVYRVVERDGLWSPAREVRHNLPTERDAFVGRHADLQALARIVDGGAHLVTVLGPGGTGKTRLVRRYGWTWLGDFPGGVWFCDLSEADDLEGIVVAVGRALGVQPGDDPIPRIGDAIAAHGRCLVVLDNFEQITACAQVVGRWIDRAPDAVFVVTSRERLNLGGEQVLALDGLELEPAMALFEVRARGYDAGFALSDEERADVAAIVESLDGLPLAIELAAARVRLLPPAKLRERLRERFRLLAGKGAGRQATLRAAIDWSWDLLDASERSALAQLSVFEGGFGLAAAEVVVDLPEGWPMDTIQALVDKSLVRRTGDDRFDLLYSIQEYAAEKLDPSAREAAEIRHGEWAATFGSDEAVAALTGPGGPERSRAMILEIANLVAAVRRALDRGDGTVAAGAARAAWEAGLALTPAARARLTPPPPE